ncbi:hypothetical protein [Caldivirga sp. UBA161]|uniref:hypothetical protein n=1 Tax=Caldivirga sp. UBA161 TaxID=1915569 RepID=UPI0025C61B6A|nr:hypothetical protein [Caldivirga sp. UBA161]
MDVLIEVNPLRIKPEEVSGLQVTLNTVDYIKGNWGKSLLELAIELEEYEPVTIRVPTPRRIKDFTRIMELANYLNLSKVIIRPPGSNLDEFLNVAAEYNIVLSWFINAEAGIPPIPPPHRVSLTVDIPSFKGLRRLLEFLLPNLNIVSFMYAHNIKNGKGGYPIMNGPIDYLKIARILAALGWNGAAVLSYRDEFTGNYRNDVNALKVFIESAGSTVLDKGTLRMLNSIMRRLMGNS